MTATQGRAVGAVMISVVATSTVYSDARSSAIGFEEAVRQTIGGGCRGFLTDAEFDVVDTTTYGIESVRSYHLYQDSSKTTELKMDPFQTSPIIYYSLPDQTIAEIGMRTRVVDFEPVAGGDFVRAQNPTLVANTYRIATTESERRPAAGLLGDDLALLCTTESSSQQEVTRVIESTFAFNSEGVPNGPTTVAITGPTPVTPTTAGYGSASASGHAYAQAIQEEIDREDDTITWLFKKAKMLFSERKVASAGDIYMPQDRSFVLILDASKNWVDVKRSETPLEGGFQADSVLVKTGATVAVPDAFSRGDLLLVGGSLTFEDTKSSGSTAPAQRSSFKTEGLSGSAFAAWSPEPFSIGFEADMALTFKLIGTYGTGDLDYMRKFDASYRPSQQSNNIVTVSDTLQGRLSQEGSAISFHVQAEQPVGSFVFRPRASVLFGRFEKESMHEQVTDGFDNGLGMRFYGNADEWTEWRVGGQISFSEKLSDKVKLTLSIGADAVFVDDAETPVQTASFVQDLRAAPHIISYRIDNLDNEFYDLSATASLELDNRVGIYATAYTREGHSNTELTGIEIGLRLTQ